MKTHIRTFFTTIFLLVSLSTIGGVLKPREAWASNLHTVSSVHGYTNQCIYGVEQITFCMVCDAGEGHIEYGNGCAPHPGSYWPGTQGNGGCGCGTDAGASGYYACPTPHNNGNVTDAALSEDTAVCYSVNVIAKFPNCQPTLPDTCHNDAECVSNHCVGGVCVHANMGQSCGCGSGTIDCAGNCSGTPGPNADCATCASDCDCASGYCKQSNPPATPMICTNTSTYLAPCQCGGHVDCHGACIGAKTPATIANCSPCLQDCECASNHCSLVVSSGTSICTANTSFGQTCGCGATFDCQTGACSGAHVGNQAQCAACTLDCDCAAGLHCDPGVLQCVPANFGTVCPSGLNACNVSTPGTIGCLGTCSVSVAPNPPSLPYTCTP